ncbi:MAG: AMP-binding protein [Hyphomonadaceae bacterium]|nr:AMP-binding protein [Clostridia bacterium]
MSNFINKTLGDFLDDISAQHPTTEALVFPQTNLRYTYAQFNEVCKQAAKGFLKLGIKKGDHVAIWATNYPEWVVTMFATAKIGAVLVTVNTSYKVFELEYLLKQSDASTLIMIDGFKDSHYVEIINKLIPDLKTSTPGDLHCEKVPFLKNVIYLDEHTPDGMLNWKQIMAMGEGVSDEVLYAVQNTLDAHEVINMQYTSGTTGFPKGVMLTHYNIINNGLLIGDKMHFSPIDRLCIPVPFFHCFGLVLAVLACVTHASTMVPVEFYSPTAVMQTIAAEKCTAVHGVPSMFIFMLEHPDFEKYDLSSLRTGIMAGSPCPISVMKQAIDKMGMREIVISYGQTEASPVITMTDADDSIEKRVSTVGKAMAQTEVKVVNPETGETLGAGQQGELCTRGYLVMKGYYKMEEATRTAIDAEGWLHTGDLTVMDEEGYYKISGRMKDMIIRGGENIYPREIEELIYTHPSVQDVQVVGVPSKKFGEEVMAFIILKDSATWSEDECKQFVLNNMARHKVPSYVQFVASYPMTASGKIQKFKLREAAIRDLGLQDAASVETA